MTKTVKRYRPGSISYVLGRVAVIVGILAFAAVILAAQSDAYYIETQFSDIENNTAVPWPNVPYEIAVNSSQQIQVCSGSLDSGTGQLDLTCHFSGNTTIEIDRPVPVKADVVGADLFHQYLILLCIFAIANTVSSIVIVYIMFIKR